MPALTGPLFDTALLLVLVHLLGDYTFQTGWMIQRKAKLSGMAAHIAVHTGLLALALGQSPLTILALAAAHLVIDLAKTHAVRDSLWIHILDQVAHYATIALALWLGAQTRWTLPPEAVPMLVVLCGLIVTTQMGGPLIGYLMAPFRLPAPPEGLAEAGRIIGILERAMIFLLVLVGEPGGIGFLIAAKSILRFDTVSQDRRASEYVIIGTLASFGWALAFSFVTVWAMTQVAP